MAKLLRASEADEDRQVEMKRRGLIMLLSFFREPSYGACDTDRLQRPFFGTAGFLSY